MARASRTSQARAARQAKMLYDMCAMAIVAGRADLDGADEVGFDIELPMFTVGRAGELANVHPQTLRQYDRLGLVVPQRTDGGARRYSLRDISRLAKAQQLSQEEGINLLASRGSFLGRGEPRAAPASRAIAPAAGSSVSRPRCGR